MAAEGLGKLALNPGFQRFTWDFAPNLLRSYYLYNTWKTIGYSGSFGDYRERFYMTKTIYENDNGYTGGLTNPIKVPGEAGIATKYGRDEALLATFHEKVHIAAMDKIGPHPDTKWEEGMAMYNEHSTWAKYWDDLGINYSNLPETKQTEQAAWRVFTKNNPKTTVDEMIKMFIEPNPYYQQLRYK